MGSPPPGPATAATAGAPAVSAAAATAARPAALAASRLPPVLLGRMKRTRFLRAWGRPVAHTREPAHAAQPSADMATQCRWWARHARKKYGAVCATAHIQGIDAWAVVLHGVVHGEPTPAELSLVKASPARRTGKTIHAERCPAWAVEAWARPYTCRQAAGRLPQQAWSKPHACTHAPHMTGRCCTVPSQRPVPAHLLLNAPDAGVQRRAPPGLQLRLELAYLSPQAICQCVSLLQRLLQLITPPLVLPSLPGMQQAERTRRPVSTGTGTGLCSCTLGWQGPAIACKPRGSLPPWCRRMQTCAIRGICPASCTKLRSFARCV
jgi:hypothetical protein